MSTESALDGKNHDTSMRGYVESLVNNGILRKVWPMSPPVAIAVLATVVPTSCILNRGFTQWFHWAFVLYQLTQWAFLERMLALSGLSICLGWYAVLTYEYVRYDRFCHPLYKNMPSSLTKYMILEVAHDDSGSGDLDFESTASLAAMALAHVLDMLAHPALTYYFWHRHCRRVAGSDPAASFSVHAAQILTWPVVLAAYTYSRLWSLTHSHYNFGYFGFFYVGHDVYIMDDLDSWFPAYVAEGLVFGSVAFWKLNLQPLRYDNHEALAENCGRKVKVTSGVRRIGNYETKPSLLLSESTISVESTTQLS